MELPFDVDEETRERLEGVAEEAVMREAKRQKLLDRMDDILADSEMTGEKAVELGRDVDRNVTQQLEEHRSA